MILSKILRKPDWESGNLALRLAAVRDSAAPELLAVLPDLARRDPAPTVRLAALERIDDLALLADRRHHDDDAKVRHAARARYLALLLAATSEVEVAAAERALRIDEDGQIAQAVASDARSPRLRRAMLERLARPGLLAERCQRDPDPELRAWIVGRIEDPRALDRIGERARSSDKTIARLARERAQALRLAAGDPATLRERAHAIGAELDRLRRERPADVPVRRDLLRTEWQQLAARLDADLVRRVQGYFAALDDALEPPRTTTAPQPVTEEPPVPVMASVPGPEPEAAPAASVAEAVPLVENPPAAPTPPESSNKRERSAALAEFEARLALLEQELEAGHLAGARQRDGELHDVALAAPLPRLLQQRKARAESELAKLERWQHWSANKQRARLCEEVAALLGGGMHPDAVATRVRELQTAWTRLDANEHRRPDTESGLEKRFRALCHRALAPTRNYFEQRHGLREKREAEVRALLAEIEAGLASADAGQRDRWRHAATERLRRIDELEPRRRGELAQRLRSALDRLRAAEEAQASDVEAQKRKLIARLKRELPRASPEDALSLAKDIQAQWKSLGRASRAGETALWSELRALIDPVFERVRAREQNERRAGDERQRTLTALIEAVDSLARGDADTLRHAPARLETIERQWRDLAVRERDAERRFDAARQRLRVALEATVRARRIAERAALWQADALLAECEAAVVAGRVHAFDLAQALAELPLGNVARQAIDARAQRALQWLAASPSIETWQLLASAALAQAEALAIQAEFLAAVDSPPAVQRARREYQVRRLAERLGGTPPRALEAEAAELLLNWCGNGPLPLEEATALRERLRRALEALDTR
jgi:hypothetical protein